MKLRQVAARGFELAGRAWLVLGVCLLILLSLEACYRLQGAGRRAVRAVLSDAPATHPYAAFDWYAGFLREEQQSNALVWRSYVYFRRRPFAGQYINVDSLGRRRTVQPELAAGEHETVLFFGGSTMFGSPQRDAFTLPSRLAARMERLPAPERQVRFVNLGETGYVFTQSVLELLMQLRAGARPQVIVFYDGINDVMSALQSGAGGLPQNEQNRAREFALGRVLFNWKTDAAAELSAAATLASLGLGRLQIVQRLGALGAAPAQSGNSADSIAARVAASYTETARIVEALANEYGFQALYVWQPTLHSTRKALTPHEAALRREIDAQPFQTTIREVHERLPA